MHYGRSSFATADLISSSYWILLNSCHLLRNPLIHFIVKGLSKVLFQRCNLFQFWRIPIELLRYSICTFFFGGGGGTWSTYQLHKTKWKRCNYLCLALNIQIISHDFHLLDVNWCDNRSFIIDVCLTDFVCRFSLDKVILLIGKLGSFRDVVTSYRSKNFSRNAQPRNIHCEIREENKRISTLWLPTI